MTSIDRTGIVVIGRNEGDRLRVCLESAIGQAPHVVYVDSGSTDESLSIAAKLGATIVELNQDEPFTAARARNAGFERLAESVPTLDRVQFIDGDCEIEPGWIDTAQACLDAHPDVVVVCGRRSERFPEHSVYNLLCDMEWDTPIGEAAECGGDAMMRADAFRAVGGFSDDLIAGEEPELCARLIGSGGRVLRIDAPMTRHDARMDRLAQWWMRNVRAGHADAEGARRHAPAGSGRALRSMASIWFWGLALPIVAGLAGLIWGLTGALLVALIYPIQIARIALGRPKPNFSGRQQWIYAAACVLGKLPNTQGQLRYWQGRVTGRRSVLIEYKEPAPSNGESS